MSDNLIKFDNTTIDEILRITPDGKLVSNHEALKPVIDRIEQLERERDELSAALDENWVTHQEVALSALRLAKAMKTLRWVVGYYDRVNPLRSADCHKQDCACDRCKFDRARAVLAKLESKA